MSNSMHPNARIITVTEPDGNKYQVLSTYPKNELNADITPARHPAWNGAAGIEHTGGQVSKFKQKYDIDFDL